MTFDAHKLNRDIGRRMRAEHLIGNCGASRREPLREAFATLR
jgi:hypothetical protein